MHTKCIDLAGQSIFEPVAFETTGKYGDKTNVLILGNWMLSVTFDPHPLPDFSVPVSITRNVKAVT